MILVKNPDEPIYGENVFVLEEELSIGEAEGREEYMFSGIQSVTIDDECSLLKKMKADFTA